MEEKKRFLDYEGFKTYHDELVKNLRDKAFDPKRMFTNKAELVDKANWEFKDYGVLAVRPGLIVTVENKFWQLADAEKFRVTLTRMGESIEEKAKYTAEELGWKIVASTTEFEIDGHTLKLFKD